MQPSYINTTIQLPLATIERQINRRIADGTIIYSDRLLTPFWKNNLFQYGIQVNIHKYNKIRLETKERYVEVRVPLLVKIALSYKAKLGLGFKLNFKPLATEGKVVSMSKITGYIRNNWQLVTQTTPLEHVWTQRAAFKILGLPVSTVSLVENEVNKILSKSAHKIDALIRQMVSIPKIVQSSWQQGQQAFLLSKRKQPAIWMQAQLAHLQFHTLLFKNNAIFLPLQLKGVAYIFSDKQGAFATISLPKQEEKKQYTADKFQLKTTINIDYEKLNLLFQNSLIGQKFIIYRQKTLEIANIALSFQREKLIVKLEISGNPSASFLITTLPSYQASDKKIVLAHFDFKILRANAFIKTLSWLGSGWLTKKIKQIAETKINNNLKQLPSSLNLLLKQQNIRHIEFKGKVKETNIQHLNFTKKGINIVVWLLGRLSVSLNGRNS